MAALFDALVALHVLCALAGFGTVGLSGVYGFRSAAAPASEEVRRYFAGRGRPEWLLLPVPVLGVAALAAQPHGRGPAQLWAGLAALVWLAAAALLVGVVRPAERRLRGAPGGAAARRLGWAGVATDVLFVVALGLMVWQPR